MKTFICIIVFFALCGCSLQTEEPPTLSSDFASANTQALLTTGDIRDEDTPEKRVLIRNGDISFETRDLSATTFKIKSSVDDLCGYVASEESESRGDRTEYFIRVRVPADQFDAFLDGISLKTEQISEKHIHVQDQTSQWVDLEANIRTQRAVEKRYLAILQETKNVRNVIDIEKQLSKTRLEIEKLEAKAQMLSRQVDYSTLDIYYYQQLNYGNEFWHGVVEGLENGWQLVKKFLLFMFSIWPLLLVGTIALIWYYAIKRRKSKEPPESEGPEDRKT